MSQNPVTRAGGKFGLSSKEKRDPMGIAILALNKLGQSPLLDKLKMRKQAEERKAQRELESRLGVRLLHRTTRRLSLTDEGRTFLDYSQRTVVTLEELEGVFAARAGELRGLRIVEEPPALRHFTGSIEHNRALETHARERGLSPDVDAWVGTMLAEMADANDSDSERWH